MKEQKDYTYRSMHEEREYGFFWYSALWRVLRPILVVAASLVVIIGLISAGWSWVYGEFLAPVNTEDPQQISFEITSGESLSRVSRELEEAGLIRSKTVFKYYCDFSGFGQKIQAGSYLLSPDMTMDQIADRLTTGDGNPIVRNITLIPGETVEEFAAKLVKNGVLDSTGEFLELCRTGTAFTDFYYVADVLNSSTASQKKYVLEGYLAPDTYEVYTTATAEEIIRKLLSQTDQVYPEEYTERATALGMTMDEVITMASMIEKEGKNSDFTRISAVFHNRLKAGMKLQSDVTIHYITGIRKMALADSDLALNDPYNTYVVSGLPAGPICNPSQEAIYAALYPDETYTAENYLYFCAKDPESGELYFSRTLQEHEQAVAIYSPLWKAYDEERGIQ